MGNRGADAPTGTSEPVRLCRSVDTSTASIRTSCGHPLRALRASQHGHYRRFLDRAIYILSSAMLHALAALIRRANASTKNCSVVGGSRDFNKSVLVQGRVIPPSDLGYKSVGSGEFGSVVSRGRESPGPATNLAKEKCSRYGTRIQDHKVVDEQMLVRQRPRKRLVRQDQAVRSRT
jgi:hypothetical protein